MELRYDVSYQNGSLHRKGHTANIKSGRIETEPDVDHVFSNLPNAIISFIEGIEGVPEPNTDPSAHWLQRNPQRSRRRTR